jgi:hypothetical protein
MAMINQRRLMWLATAIIACCLFAFWPLGHRSQHSSSTDVRRELAEFRCMNTVIAAERHRLATGRWPESLASLAPAFIEAVPTDPYTGEPLRYRRIDDGILIYAVGADLVDNGGTLAALPKDIDDAGTDIGFRLRNPDRRHLPADISSSSNGH